LKQPTVPQSSPKGTSIIQKETPRCRQCREPRIPRRAEQRGEEGYATFRLYISASGKVIETQLLKSSGHSGFINSARKAAMTSTFHPMTQKNTKDIMYVMKMNNK
jgi:TonB family protein